MSLWLPFYMEQVTNAVDMRQFDIDGVSMQWRRKMIFSRGALINESSRTAVVATALLCTLDLVLPLSAAAVENKSNILRVLFAYGLIFLRK